MLRCLHAAVCFFNNSVVCDVAVLVCCGILASTESNIRGGFTLRVGPRSEVLARCGGNSAGAQFLRRAECSQGSIQRRWRPGETPLVGQQTGRWRHCAYIVVVVRDNCPRKDVLPLMGRKPKTYFRKYQFVTNDRDISPSRVLAFSLPSRLDNM